jgi:hypothetical protein
MDVAFGIKYNHFTTKSRNDGQNKRQIPPPPSLPPPLSHHAIIGSGLHSRILPTFSNPATDCKFGK